MNPGPKTQAQTVTWSWSICGPSASLKKKKTQLNNQVKKAEQQIEKLEAEIKELDDKIAVLDYSDEENSGKVLNLYEDKKKQLDSEMEKWENATEELLEISD